MRIQTVGFKSSHRQPRDKRSRSWSPDRVIPPKQHCVSRNKYKDKDDNIPPKWKLFGMPRHTDIHVSDSFICYLLSINIIRATLICT